MAVELDGVRGLAALCVAFFHYWKIWGENLDVSPFRSWYAGLFNGSFSVAVFFVLSGRVIMGSAFAQHQSRLTGGDDKPLAPLLANALLRRVIRLFLPCLLVLLLLFFLARLPLLITATDRLNRLIDVYGFPGIAREYGHLGQELRGEGVQRVLWDVGALMLRTPWVAFVPLSPVTWTLHHELVGSMALFAITPFVLTYPRFGFHALVLATFLASTVSKDDTVQVDCFLGGLVLCVLHYAPKADSLRTRSRISTAFRAALRIGFRLFLGIYVLLVWTTTDRGAAAVKPLAVHPWRAPLLALPVVSLFNPITLETWAAIAFIYLVERVGPLQRMFGSKPFRWLGKISFTLYLLHPFVFTFVGSSFLSLFLPAPPATPPTPGTQTPVDVGAYERAVWLFTLPIAFLAIMLVATALCPVLDRPSVTFGRWIVAKLNSKETTVAGTAREVVRDSRDAVVGTARSVWGAATEFAGRFRRRKDADEGGYEALPLHGEGLDSPSAFLSDKARIDMPTNEEMAEFADAPVLASPDEPIPISKSEEAHV